MSGREKRTRDRLEVAVMLVLDEIARETASNHPNGRPAVGYCRAEIARMVDKIAIDWARGRA